MTAHSEPVLTLDKCELPEVRSTDVTVELAVLHEAACDYIRSSKAENTRRAYRSDWQHFDAWCEGRGFLSMPAEPATVVLYVSALAEDHKVATIGRRLAAVSQAHQAAGYETPTITAAKSMPSERVSPPPMISQL